MQSKITFCITKVGFFWITAVNFYQGIATTAPWIQWKVSCWPEWDQALLPSCFFGLKWIFSTAIYLKKKIQHQYVFTVFQLYFGIVHQSLHQKALWIIVLIAVTLKKLALGTELLNTGVAVLAERNLLACLFPYHCYLQSTIFSSVVPASAISSCMQRSIITAVSVPQDGELIISKCT